MGENSAATVFATAVAETNCSACGTTLRVICVAGLKEIGEMPLLRATLAESLRLYPQPPILIRRALNDDVLPAGLVGPATFH